VGNVPTGPMKKVQAVEISTLTASVKSSKKIKVKLFP
jgi:hypothetical protein